MTNSILIKLNQKFQKELFQKIVLYYNGSINASKFLRIPASSIRGYKNLYFNTIPSDLLERLVKLKIVNVVDLEKNILKKFERKDIINISLDVGREKRKKQLKKFRKDIPLLGDILHKNYLDFEKWFLSYKKLINFGVRKINYIKKRKNILEVSYTTHSNKEKKEFIMKFPRKIMINKDFIYFLGLWVGDKAGGKRFGIVNKEKSILNYTKKFLRRFNQNTEIFLYIGSKEKLPTDFKYDKVYRISQKERGYSYSVHSVNGILTSFFNYIEADLDSFLYSLRDINLFFAGLFDAEGNVFLEDSCFRWSCKNPILREIFKTHLNRLNLFKRDDGVNLVTYNKEVFSKEILPYLKHLNKINNTNLVCFGKGNLDKRFNKILITIKNKPGSTNKDLAKALKNKKLYSQIKVLERLGYVYSKNYPKQIFICKNKIQGEN